MKTAHTIICSNIDKENINVNDSVVPQRLTLKDAHCFVSVQNNIMNVEVLESQCSNKIEYFYQTSLFVLKPWLSEKEIVQMRNSWVIPCNFWHITEVSFSSQGMEISCEELCCLYKAEQKLTSVKKPVTCT